MTIPRTWGDLESVISQKSQNLVEKFNLFFEIFFAPKMIANDSYGLKTCFASIFPKILFGSDTCNFSNFSWLFGLFVAVWGVHSLLIDLSCIQFCYICEVHDVYDRCRPSNVVHPLLGPDNDALKISGKLIFAIWPIFSAFSRITLGTYSSKFALYMTTTLYAVVWDPRMCNGVSAVMAGHIKKSKKYQKISKLVEN